MVRFLDGVALRPTELHFIVRLDPSGICPKPPGSAWSAENVPLSPWSLVDLWEVQGRDVGLGSSVTAIHFVNKYSLSACPRLTAGQDTDHLALT